MDEQSSLFGPVYQQLSCGHFLPGVGSRAVRRSDRLPQLYWPALGVATLGNTMGGMSSYAIGRLLPDEKALLKKSGGNLRGIEWVRKHGQSRLDARVGALIGDLLCVAAGWLRVNWISAMLFMAAGKFGRYWAIGAAINA